MTRLWRVGTRGSNLAQLQTSLVISELARIRPGDRFQTVVIRTAGDRDQSRPLSNFENFGVFVKEIERALLAGEIDLAVHSAKDLTTHMDGALTIAAYPRRGTVMDVLVTRRHWPQDAEGLPLLPVAARVGTSSVRRHGQLKEWRPDLQLENLRGNIETRLRKLTGDDLDGIVLAAAGLERLGLLPAGPSVGQVTAIKTPGGTAYVYPLDPHRFVPAAGQGALAVQVRADREDVVALVAALDDPDTRLSQVAERAFMARMGASCQVPIGALAQREGSSLRLIGYYSASNPSRRQVVGAVQDAYSLGTRLAQEMMSDVIAATEDIRTEGR